MLDLAAVQGFDWDAGNGRKRLDKHEVTQAEAEQVFFNEPLLLAGDVLHSQSEVRLHALGQTDNGRRLQITFVMRRHGQLVRVISARDMSRKERTYHEQGT